LILLFNPDEESTRQFLSFKFALASENIALPSALTPMAARTSPLILKISPVEIEGAVVFGEGTTVGAVEGGAVKTDGDRFVEVDGGGFVWSEEFETVTTGFSSK